MSERDPLDAAPGAADEPLLSRWSRLKSSARSHAARPAAARPVVADPAATAAVTPAFEAAPQTGGPAAPVGDAAPSTEAPPPVELPDLDTLGEDSDYSAFLSPGVDGELRKRALRQLFRSPKFNVFDGLDTYRDDFTSFPPLGDVITADMRYQMERAARELAERAKAALLDDAPAPAAAVATQPPDRPALPADDAAQAAAAPGVSEDALPDDATTGRNEDDAAHGPA